ncbi:MAG TPA: protein kinase [Solirubrobacteraceae bacterium]
MRCTACGHENRPDATFCRECGTRFAKTVACPRCGRASAVGQRFCDACGEPLAAQTGLPAASQAAPAAFANGRYRIERFLGEGANKRVYLARDTTLDREVAFAFIRVEALDEGRADRIRREAQAMGRLAAHPNVVTVYDAGEEAGAPYIVEEYLDGGTVADVLLHSDPPARPLPIERAVRIAADVCAALDHAHGHGVVHRDLKPSNVWLTADGTAKLGDFGLVAALRQSESATIARLTGEGMMVGTIDYIAPEQALGRAPEPRADLYSLGAMLYELVTGQAPFAGDDALTIITQHLRTPPVAPAWRNPEVSKPLDALIVHLLAKDPRERPQSAAEVGEALAALAAPARRRPSTVEVGGNPLDRLAGGVHVGREREVDELCDTADLALAGRGQLVLISGEPGIGKTRLAEELTTYAHLRDALVLWGRCYEGEGAPAYWPWMQIVRAYSVDHEPWVLSETMGPGAADIAQIVSEVRRRLPGLEPPAAVGTEQARFRLFDSVTTFLLNATRREPLVVVLDDLQCADRPSLRLLEFLAPQIGDARLLVVGTYRDTELHAQHPLAQTLGELARVRPPRRIALRGLTRAQVARYVAMTAGLEPDEALVDAVHAKSEGNPFFVAEIVRLLSAEGRLESAPGEIVVPQEVRELVGRRLAPLSAQCREALAIAAVIGRDFDLRVLQEVAAIGDDRTLEALDEAQAARVIFARAPGRYRFAHVLISDTLADGLPPSRRLHLHRRVGEALERVLAGRLEPHIAELAHHFLEAASAGDVERGLRYATAAAEHASTRLAHEEAAGIYERALTALDLVPASGARRCDLLLALGEAHHRAGAHGQARVAFRHAAEAARELSSPERLARAALGYGGPRGSFGVVDEELVGLLEEALAALGARDDAVRARLLARLAMELYFAGAGARRAALVDEALAIARRLGDPATLAYALNARYAALWGPENVEERLAIADEVVELARRARNDRLAREGRGRRIVALLEIGDVADAHAEIEVHARAAEELRQPYGRWQAAVWRAAEALLAGRFAEGESRAHEAFELGRRVRMTDAEHCFAIQSFIAAMELGRLAELQATVEQLATRYPETTRWRAGLAYLHTELGRRDEAAVAFEEVAARGFAAVERDNQWLVAMTDLADTCAFLGDARRAAELRDLLLPYAGRNVVIVEGWACLGSADRPLGLLASTIGLWDEAQAHFEAALDLNARLGARPWLARTELAYARMLLGRRHAGDTERAQDVLRRALATAKDLGMTTLTGRVEVQLATTAS